MNGEKIHQLEVYTCQLETLETFLKETIEANNQYLKDHNDEPIEEQNHLCNDLLGQLEKIAEQQSNRSGAVIPA